MEVCDTRNCFIQ